MKKLWMLVWRIMKMQTCLCRPKLLHKKSSGHFICSNSGCEGGISQKCDASTIVMVIGRNAPGLTACWRERLHLKTITIERLPESSWIIPDDAWAQSRDDHDPVHFCLKIYEMRRRRAKIVQRERTEEITWLEHCNQTVLFIRANLFFFCKLLNWSWAVHTALILFIYLMISLFRKNTRGKIRAICEAQ